ncbi:DoxX family membrane protein [uncultured Roseobacter sp.]|uniref:DoxX family protein n=1 Tax=uncultured Roseobacter sp. TaxID=114847 RepID=UPI00261AE842|nr:DoxX family membrane protein [uncultured Roseobacter sp.]
MNSQVTTRQAFALMALRISLGMLLVWWGLSKIVKPGMGVKIQDKFYFGFFPSENLQYIFGYLELLIGSLVVLGLFRTYAVLAQLLVTGFSALTIWSALLDPFALWLPVSKVSGMQHLFYPSVIALCGAAVMLAFRSQDRFNLDQFIQHRRRNAISSTVPAE